MFVLLCALLVIPGLHEVLLDKPPFDGLVGEVVIGIPLFMSLLMQSYCSG
jgi:hypothetical protein